MEQNLLIIFCLLFAALAVLIGLLIRQVYKLHKRIDILLNNSGNSSIEHTLFDYYHEIKDARIAFSKNDEQIKKLDELSKTFFNKHALIQYNAYGDMGGEMSFVLCMLTLDNNGFLINSIHSRNGTRVYSKKVIAGKYTGSLSGEESQALERALQI